MSVEIIPKHFPISFQGTTMNPVSFPKITLDELVGLYLKSIPNPGTRMVYESAFKMIFLNGMLDPKMSVADFAVENVENIGDRIRVKTIGSESLKQLRVSAFISFTSWLQRRTGGKIKKMIPSKEKHNKTFKKIREKCATRAMSSAQATVFLAELESFNFRDYLIAVILLRSCSRISEVLAIKDTDIDWENSQIRIQVKKTQTEKVFKSCTLHPDIKLKLKRYIGNTKGFVFITKNGVPPLTMQIRKQFKLIGKRAGIPFSVSPHVLRATGVTLYLEDGFTHDEVQRLSKHESAEMVRYYDKRSLQNNPSRSLVLCPSSNGL